MAPANETLQQQATVPVTADSTQENPLRQLVVFEALHVGPVHIERKRLVAPYRLIHKGGESSMDLVFRYEEPVFDPAEPTSQNLAAMITAQVALNYGLFCKAIVFHGPFDGTDHQFLRGNMENTAREIYVKKFLEPNPFLIGPAASLAAVKQARYTQAVVKFDPPTVAQTHWQHWDTHRNRHAILSSGGKDSLLSLGLIQELGFEAFPLFVNESGRHWFTALNAYRHFKDHVPGTARVWTNSDRVFNWMLRQMPFIKPNFADMRSDEYPVRLWTVAVFLFGVLPIMRKHGYGRLLIGDEHDTSRRLIYKGITHYDGLYDQSRFFDNALSRYFMRKGWAVSQFSILRPLSEMLIEKILAERYPELQELQTSCHATHVDQTRVLPCGKCEKCRRIVGMLKAIDVDPRRCGYSETQIQECLVDLARKGVHQEADGVRHLLYLLNKKGLLPPAPEGKYPKKPLDTVLKLRISPRYSPFNDIPVDLRLPLLRIFDQHSAGSLLEKGRTSWTEFDPTLDPSLEDPYPFELRDMPQQPKGEPQAEEAAHNYLWGELTWCQAEKRLQEVDVALLPVGSIEQHGPHLTLDTDAFDAEYLTHRVAEACSDPKPLVLPLVAYGVSYHHDAFKGTISIGNETLSNLVFDIGISLARNGIKKLVIINGHGGNGPALNYAAQKINRETHILVCVDSGETSDVDIDALIDTENDVHSGEIETSTTLAVRPHLVDMNLAKKLVPAFSSRYLNFTTKRGISWYASTEKISATGVMGDPTKANAEKGRRIWEIMIAHLVALVEDLKGASLDEIHQKRY